uniref:Uncharacterized protein n=1 Tax=Arundo donax TaxID=35708 RepID=A0A0A9ERS2_ARUDO
MLTDFFLCQFRSLWKNWEFTSLLSIEQGMGKVIQTPGGMSRATHWILRSSPTSWSLGRSSMS